MGRLIPRVAVLLGALVATGCARRVVVMSWNVKNLFDTCTDGTEYADLQDADALLFRRKCEVIAGAIRDAVPGGPDIVALQEIENLGVLLELRDGWLRGLGYRYCVAAGGKGTAVRVGFLSRLPILGAWTHSPAPDGDEVPRAILEIECRAQGETLRLLNNHWKSRIGGVAATEGARVRAARTVRTRLAALIRRDPGAQVVVLGDLNESEDTRGARGPSALGDVLALTADGAALARRAEKDDPGLYEPWLETGAPEGSYAYAGRWERPDHVLLSPGLLDGRGLEYREGSFRVVDASYLLDRGTGLPRGSVTRGSTVYPDHLPILVVLEPRVSRSPAPAPRG